MSNEREKKFWTQDAGPTWVARMDAMDRNLAPVLDAVLRVADLRSGEQVLDIGCGAGTSTLQSAEQVGPTGHVCGVDISETLLSAARDHAANVPNVSYLLADAQAHAFEPAAIDCLMSRFGVMFFEDTAAAFANMAGALRGGGRVVFATWGAIPENPFFTLPAQVASGVMGKPPKADPDAPGPLALRDTVRVCGLLEAAGLTRVAAREIPMMLTPPGTAADVADMLCDIGSAQRILLHFDGDPADRARVAAALSAELTQFETPDGIRIPALINIFTATKPA